MSKNHTTKISSSGLRYKSKELGSPFGESVGVATMSCYKCVVHKSRAKGSFKKIIGQRMFICGECKPVV